ncbi:MAG: exodeoxyribonuclease VII small subunit [Pseudomonadales bacterium]|jgi:exodeoxyribonuclease VII small subunit|nr:exodeoxyribonuclease VII small subunit [Pseudomonadales bacterium]MDP6469594.1 exodeoxyribonuclease VII small subunit [Pseudomonadales bacterium]MDP6827435.1 exodeoxyribonuclease VII small subunit [Pseudomonadales bacterium]MDP6971258.1 exodeoxyribonuclease VII small subunit [Pseudomonadales bacterium]|tara:strand:- start:3005 stop:3250 length:246 start_codon:yes stop_codon:yes gene_type:complete
MAKTQAKPDDELSFEETLEELETLVQRMESGELGLEDSLKAFERGIKLTRACQDALKNAELKVQTLTEAGELEDLDVDDLE